MFQLKNIFNRNLLFIAETKINLFKQFEFLESIEIDFFN